MMLRKIDPGIVNDCRLHQAKAQRWYGREKEREGGDGGWGMWDVGGGDERGDHKMECVKSTTHKMYVPTKARRTSMK